MVAVLPVSVIVGVISFTLSSNRIVVICQRPNSICSTPGIFALEDKHAEIAALMGDYLARKLTRERLRRHFHECSNLTGLAVTTASHASDKTGITRTSFCSLTSARWSSRASVCRLCRKLILARNLRA